MSFLKNFIANVTGSKTIDITANDLLSFNRLLNDVVAHSFSDLETSIRNKDDDRDIEIDLVAHKEIQSMLLTVNKYLTDNCMKLGHLSTSLITEFNPSRTVKIYIIGFIDTRINNVLRDQYDALTQTNRENLIICNNELQQLLKLKTMLKG